jgi:hypothetical protein
MGLKHSRRQKAQHNEYTNKPFVGKIPLCGIRFWKISKSKCVVNSIKTPVKTENTQQNGTKFSACENILAKTKGRGKLSSLLPIPQIRCKMSTSRYVFVFTNKTQNIGRFCG